MRKSRGRSVFSFAPVEGLETRTLYSAAVPSTTSITSSASQAPSTLNLTVASSWSNSPLASKSSAFQLVFDVTPTQNDGNVVIGLSNSAAAAYTDLAAIVRFNPTGQIDVRNGSNYQADATVNYSAGISYQFRLVVDPTTRAYNVYVTPAGGSQILLAQNYAFRSEQAGTSTLANLGGYGLAGSAAVTGISLTTVTPGTLLPAPSLTVGSSWINTAISSESSPFQLAFDATPAQNDENVVIGLSNGAAAAYTDLAAIVRFNPTGQIDVRNGSNYQADATVNYTAGTSYQFQLILDPTTHTYSVYVTPAGGSEILLAQNYSFRSEQANTSTLANLGGYSLAGSAAVTGITLTPLTSAIPPQESIGSTWQNSGISSQTEAFTLNFSATPEQNDENVVIGLSNGPASAYTDLAAIARFNPTGQIDVRNGSNYQADATVNYTAGITYEFTMVIDPMTQTYSVYVTPAGGSQIVLAQNYAFRTEQANTTTLNNFGGYSLVGAAEVTNVSINAGAPAQSVPPIAPVAPVAPVAPSGLSATAFSTSEVDLSWNSTGSVLGFYILRSTNNQTFTQIATVGATATTYADTTVSSSTTYYYEVEAYNAVGASGASNVDSATTPSPVTSPPPTEPTSNPGTTGTLPNGGVLPGPTNTGPVAGTVLTPSGITIVTTAGTVLKNLSFTAPLEIDAPNVTVENCTFTFADNPSGVGGYFGVLIDYGADNFVMENSSLTGGGPGFQQICQNANNAQYINLNIYDTPKTVFYLSGSATISGCWLHEVGWNGLGITSNPNKANFTGTDHVDDVYFERGAYLILTGNNFDTMGNPTLINGVNYTVASAGIFIEPYATGDVTGPVTINNNYLDGGSYLFQLDGQGTTSITNNIIGPDESYGVIDGSYVGAAWSWSGNIDQNGNVIPIPTGIGDILGTA